MNSLVHVPLGEVAKLNPTFKAKDVAHEKLVDFLPMSAVSAELTTACATEQRPFNEVQKGYTNFADGDVLLAKITPCFENGKIAFANVNTEYGFGSTEFHVIRADRERLDGRYLVHFLRRDEIRVDGARNMTGSAGQRRVPKHYLESLSIPLLSLPEQRRIAAILDQADALRAKRREALAQLDTLTQSIFIEMFGDPVENPNGWQPVRLSDVSDIVTGFAFKSEDYVDGSSSSIKLCRGANVMPGRLDWSDLASWPASKIEQISAFQLQAGDIVMAMDRPWISEGFKVSQVSKNDCPSLLVQRVARLRGIGEVSNDYIYHLLNHPVFTAHCRPTETTIPHISPREIRSFRFHLPPVPLQRNFVNRVSCLNNLKSSQVESLKELNALFASLQHRTLNLPLESVSLNRDHDLACLG